MVGLKTALLLLALLILGFILYRSTLTLSVGPEPYTYLANCKAMLAHEPICINSEGGWKSELSNIPIEQTKDKYFKYCILKGGALFDTEYRTDDAHFNCGPKPV
ncbi:MAG: hypothetical protein ABH863_00770 [Candidatus Micrarchaeota archaeon]